jgi:hypothetical protein
MSRTGVITGIAASVAAATAIAFAVIRMNTWSYVQPEVAPAVDLEAFNRARVAWQERLIDSLTVGGDWRVGETGLRYRCIESQGNEVNLDRGEWVHWNVRVGLADGQQCFKRLLLFKWQAMDVPIGFHDLAELSAPGDSIEAWLPSHLGWGLSGDGRNIPPDEVIQVSFRVMDIR